MKVFNDLKTRGCNDILIAVTDGLKGMPEALGAVYPATTLQTCIVHLIRNSLDYAPGKSESYWQRRCGRSTRRPVPRLLKPLWTTLSAVHGARNSRPWQPRGAGPGAT